MLRTGRSRSVTPHPASRRRSYGSIPHDSSPRRSGLAPLCLAAVSGALGQRCPHRATSAQPRSEGHNIRKDGALGQRRPTSEAAVIPPTSDRLGRAAVSSPRHVGTTQVRGAQYQEGRRAGTASPYLGSSGDPTHVRPPRIGVGRADSPPPSLQTGQADLPHPAFQSMGLLGRGAALRLVPKHHPFGWSSPLRLLTPGRLRRGPALRHSRRSVSDFPFVLLPPSCVPFAPRSLPATRYCRRSDSRPPVARTVDPCQPPARAGSPGLGEPDCRPFCLQPSAG